MEFMIMAIFILAVMFFIAYKIIGAETLFGAGLILVAVGTLISHAVNS